MDYIEVPVDGLLGPYQPEWQLLNDATSEAPFLEAGFYLLRELCQLVAAIASLRPEVALDRNRAILRGLLVRLTKLLRLTLRELMAEECFQQLNVQRSVLETLGTLKYLTDDDASGVRYDQYVMNSLVAERELVQDIKNKVSQRDDALLHIEQRMLRSIKTTAEAAGITDVSSLPGRSKIGWPSAERRIQLLGPDAYVAYRAGSTEVHGDWTDLFRNHLEYDGVSFQPRLEDLHIRPQTSLTPAVLVSDFLAAHADSLIEISGRLYFVTRLKDLTQRAGKATGLHEQLLARF